MNIIFWLLGMYRAYGESKATKAVAMFTRAEVLLAQSVEEMQVEADAIHAQRAALLNVQYEIEAAQTKAERSLAAVRALLGE